MVVVELGGRGFRFEGHNWSREFASVFLCRWVWRFLTVEREVAAGGKGGGSQNLRHSKIRILHAAVVTRKGKALILLAATPSRTGKLR